MYQKKILIPFMLITAATFILNTTMQMSIPTFSVYLKSLGVPVGYIGAVSLSTALAAMFFRPVSAILNRKIGSIETGLIGAFGYLIAFLILIFFKNPSMVILARVIQGIGMGIGITTLGSIIAQIVPHDDLLKGMNIYSLFASASGAIGPYIGMFLIADGLYLRLFISAAGLVLVGIATLAILHFKVHLPLPKDLHTLKSSVPITRSAALFPTLVSFLTAFVYAAIASYLSLYGIDIGIPNVGFFFLASFIGLLLSRVALQPLMGQLPLGKLFIVLGSAYAGLLWSLTVFHSVWAWTLIAIGYGFIFNLISTILNTMAIKNVPIADKAKANALLFVGLDSGFFMGGLVWGQIAQNFSTAGVFMGAAILIFLAMGISGLLVTKKNIAF